MKLLLALFLLGFIARLVYVRIQKSERWRAVTIWRQKPICQNCGTLWGLKLADSCTAYPWDGKGRDPNAPVLLCPRCSEDHYEHWHEMWSEYYAGRI
jgi:hypothetical protein